MASRRELTEAIADRYRVAGRDEKQKILDEFTQVTGFHRKHAIRVLARKAKVGAATPYGQETPNGQNTRTC